VDSIIESMKQIAELYKMKFREKNDHNVITLLREDEIVFEEVVDRSLSLKIAEDFILTNNTNEKSESRFRNPIIATQGAPGTGKTRFIDYLSKKLTNEHQMVLPITFNGATQGIQTHRNMASEISYRILYSYFFTK